LRDGQALVPLRRRRGLRGRLDLRRPGLGLGRSGLLPGRADRLDLDLGEAAAVPVVAPVAGASAVLADADLVAEHVANDARRHRRRRRRRRAALPAAARAAARALLLRDAVLARLLPTLGDLAFRGRGGLDRLLVLPGEVLGRDVDRDDPRRLGPVLGGPAGGELLL